MKDKNKKIEKKEDVISEKKVEEEDVIMKLISKDKALVRRDLEARLARVKRQ